MLKNSHFWRVWLPPHLLAIGGLFLFNNKTVWITALAGYILISGLGVAVGLHRYFSHKSFVANRFWQQAMLYFGCLACHGNPLFWVALHRGLHHRYTDDDKDPHSPLHGIWHAYQGYAFSIHPNTVPIKAAADFLRHPEWHWTHKYYLKVLYGTWIVLGLISPSLLVGLAIAQVWAIHQEAIVNVLGHTPGFGAYRNFATKDESVNRPILGLFTWGQALHNNHHHDAASYDFGKHKFEFDPCRIWIRIIKTLNQSTSP